MISRIHLSTLLLVGTAVWGVLLVFNGVALQPDLFKPFSTVVGVVAFLLAAFDLFLWRLTWLQGWFVKRPHLWGTWRVKFESNWIDPATHQSVAPLHGYMAIRQTFTTVSMRLMTVESSSELLAEEIVYAVDGTVRLYGVYRNEPILAVRHRSPIHHGALLLDIQGNPPESLSGHYWTDRQTAGSIFLSERRATVYDSYETAHKHFGAP